jgi:hypothetical protein
MHVEQFVSSQKLLAQLVYSVSVLRMMYASFIHARLLETREAGFSHSGAAIHYIMSVHYVML